MSSAGRLHTPESTGLRWNKDPVASQTQYNKHSTAYLVMVKVGYFGQLPAGLACKHAAGGKLFTKPIIIGAQYYARIYCQVDIGIASAVFLNRAILEVPDLDVHFEMFSLRPRLHLQTVEQVACRPAGIRIRLKTATSSGTGGRVVSTHAATAWDAWTQTLPQWSSSHTAASPKSPSDSSALAAAVKSAAINYKPRVQPKLSVPTLDDLEDVPKNLHQRLELIALVQLQNFLEDTSIKPTVVEYTTTDIAAAVSVAGVIVEGRKGRQAVMSIVACETERQMTWSRLEGLLFHWAVSQKAGAKWELPPRGFKTLPENTVDAGGAWQSQFEKHPLPQPEGVVGPEPMYTMMLIVPLEGSLATGGLTFVLKSGSTSQPTRWLKDDSTGKDFFLDLQKFNVVNK
eukprot:jgi/Chrzof1/10517/Cz05g01210.t1